MIRVCDCTPLVVFKFCSVFIVFIFVVCAYFCC